MITFGGMDFTEKKLDEWGGCLDGKEGGHRFGKASGSRVASAGTAGDAKENLTAVS